MRLHGTSKISENGNLEIAGVDVKELVREFQTPLYVMDEEHIENTISKMKENFVSDKFKTQISYAGKAFLTLAMVRIVDAMGLDLDVVSGGELYTAYKGGIPMNRVHLHGNNKSDTEIEMAVNYGIKEIVIDNENEIERIEAICQKNGKKQSVLVRVDPGVDTHTHDYIKTSGLTTKFGISVFQENLIDIIKRIANSEFLVFKGLHSHVGSQLFTSKYHSDSMEELFKFISKLKKEGINVHTLNIGGGFGVYYKESDKPLAIEEFFSDIIKCAEKLEDEHKTGFVELCIEPGRSIVANAGTTLYTVGGVKDTLGGKRYIFVDGGMADNIRPALYQAVYEASIIDKLNEKREINYKIAGKFCESGDVLIENISLPKAEVGDILAVGSTGAYCYSMSSNYNRFMKPAVVFVKGGVAKLAVKRETLDDILRNDI